MTTALWSTLEPALSTLFRRIATVPGSVPSVSGSRGPSVVEAKGQRNKVPSPSNPVTLHWYPVSIVPVGRDEIREDYDPDAEVPGDTYQPDPEDPDARLGGIRVRQHGWRSWTIEIRIESPNSSANASDHARALFDRMRLPSVHDELDAVGLAYTGWDQLLDDGYDNEEDQGRFVSVFVGRLYFNGSSFAEDEIQTTIETADVSVTVASDVLP